MTVLDQIRPYLGRFTDTEIAEKTGLRRTAVVHARQRAEIAAVVENGGRPAQTRQSHTAPPSDVAVPVDDVVRAVVARRGRPSKGLIAEVPSVRVSIEVRAWLIAKLDAEADRRSASLGRKVSRGEALDLWVREQPGFGTATQGAEVAKDEVDTRP